MGQMIIIIIVSAQIERRHCIEISDFLTRHNGNFLPNFIQKLQYFQTNFCSNLSQWAQKLSPGVLMKNGVLFARMR